MDIIKSQFDYDSKVLTELEPKLNPKKCPLCGTFVATDAVECGTCHGNMASRRHVLQDEVRWRKARFEQNARVLAKREVKKA